MNKIAQERYLDELNLYISVTNEMLKEKDILNETRTLWAYESRLQLLEHLKSLFEKLRGIE